MSHPFWIRHRLPAILLSVAALTTGCGRFARRDEASYLNKGRELAAAKDYSRALLEFRNAARAASGDGDPYYEMGLVYLHSGDYRSAIGSFRRCLELNPRHTSAQLRMAEMMTSSAQPETLSKAAGQLRELLDQSPQN